MGIKHDLCRSIQLTLRFNKTGSYATQANRKHILTTFAKDLVSIGFGLRDIRGLKRKHIEAVVKHWQDNGLSVSTIKNRTAFLRNLSTIINKPSVVPSNDELNIGKRTYKPVSNRAVIAPDFSSISNDYIKVSLELQRVFGLRREESMKIKPHMADKKECIELIPSWCKGGRGRRIPIRTAEQRYWLEQAKLIANKFGNSLIPLDKSYIQQRYIYDKQVIRSGLKNLHGLRHAYAQQRYRELTGKEPPINGGLTQTQLSKEEKEIDHQARIVISEELGHSREQITVNYLGR